MVEPGRHASLRGSWANSLYEFKSRHPHLGQIRLSFVQMAEPMVDAPVSGTGEETRAGSTPALDTKFVESSLAALKRDVNVLRWKAAAFQRHSEATSLHDYSSGLHENSERESGKAP